MNRDDTFDRTISDWLHADADHRVPERLDAVLRQTRTERQRPAWSSLERWLPLDSTFRAAALAPQPRRVALVIALVIALAGLVIVAVGSRSTRLPAPFGPARNGILMSSHDGDIFAVDPVTANQSPVVTGPSFDFGATFSRDGTKFIFLRGAPTDCGQPDCGLILMVANADGSGVRALTAGLPALDWQDWSADGTQVVIDAGAPDRNGHVIDVVDVDGSGMRTLDVGRPAHELSWLPPDGKEIVFRGERLSPADPAPGIFAVHPDGSGLREISTTPATSDNDYQDVIVSPDGGLVTYRDDGDPGGFRIHILDLRTGVDRILPGPRGQRGAVFSPDSRLVAFLRGVANGHQLVVAPLNGSNDGTALGPVAPVGPDGPTINNYSWSPDGTSVIANYDADKTARLLPVDGSPPIELAHGELALPAYQRLAP